jgi:hypothetical protein
MDAVREPAMDTTDKPDLTKDEISELAIRAINQLIDDVENKRLYQNTELAESLAVCLRYTAQAQLRTLKAVLDQRELEGIPAAPKKPKWHN